jgi:hypothetical protein
MGWPNRPKPQAALPFPSLADVWGPLVGIVILLLFVTEPDTSKESDAAPIPPCLVLHVEPLLNSSRACAALPQP